MAYTLTQARPLLTAAELELFDQSRAEPVKRLAPAELAGAIKRTRALRDKYRDLFQRQTVAVRSNAPGKVTGEDNERTQRKSDMLQQALERYQARAAVLRERGGTAAARRRTPSGAGQGADKPATTKAPKAPRAPVQSNGSGKDKKSLLSAQLNSLAGVGVRPAAQAGAADTAAAPAAPRSKAGKPGKAAQRSAKAPSRKAPTAGNKGAAPDLHAPPEQEPDNPDIHAHQSAQGRRSQGKRDSR